MPLSISFFETKQKNQNNNNQGYVFAVGSKGIYFGGKDIVVSEASGPLSFCVLPPSSQREGAEGSPSPLSSSGRFALMDMRVGAGAAAAAQEWGASSSGSAAAAAAAGAGASSSSSSPPPRRGMARPSSFSSSSSPMRRPSPSRAASGAGGAAAAAAANKAPSPSRKPGAATTAAAAAATPSPRSSRPPLPPNSSLLIPRTAEERAAAVREASAGPGQAGKAVAARFLAKIGSATAMERYARKAALPHGPREAWPGAEEEGAAAETRGVSAVAAAASSGAAEARKDNSLVGRLMKKAASRRAKKEGKAAARRAAGGSAIPAPAAETSSGAPVVGALGVSSRAASSGSLLGGGGGARESAAGAALASSSSSRAFLSEAQDDIEAAAAAEAAMPEEARGGGGEEEGEEEGINLERLLSSSSDDGDDGDSDGEREKAAAPLPPPAPDGGHLGTASAPTDAGEFTASEIAPRLAPEKEKKNAAAASTANGSTDGGGRGGGSGPRPLRVVVRLCDVALVGEKGSRCPSLSVAELSLELEIHGQLAVKYERGTGGCWSPAGKCTIDVSRIVRTVRGASVPVPPALLKLIVSAVLPPVFQRLLLGALPAEIGEYLLDAGVGAALAGDLVALGPALPSLDAPLAGEGDAAPDSGAGGEAAHRAARRDGAAAEARAVVGLSREQARVLDSLFCHPRLSLIGAVGPSSSSSSVAAAAPAAAARAGASEGGEAAAASTTLPQQQQQQQQQRLRPNPPLTLGSLVRLRHRYARHPKLWEATCAIWDASGSALAAARGIGEKPPPLESITAAAASALALKPLRASLALSHADAGCNVDAAIRCLRAYFERQARELAVVAGGGGSSPTATEAASGQLPPPPGLAAALGALEAWHAYVVSRLAGFKASFRGASARVVAQADARGLSLGAERAKYVGPLRLRLPVRLRRKERSSGGGGGSESAPDEEEGWSFEIPLPDPTSYAVKRFVDACRSAMASSASLGRVEAQAAAAVRGREKPGEPSPPPPPTRAGVADPREALGWFCVDDGERAAAGLPPLPPGASNSSASSSSVPWPAPSCVPPTKLGTISVDGARARVRLDEEAVAELLGAGGPSGGLGGAPAASAVRLARSAARVLAALGDVARLSFAPAARSSSSKASGDGGGGEEEDEFVLVAESAAAASLHVDVAGVSFATAEGVTPARLVRLAHGVARAALLAMIEGGAEAEGKDGEGEEEKEAAARKKAQLEASLASLDAKFDLAHAHLGREALDASVCLDASARVDRERLGGALVLRVRGLPPSSCCTNPDDDASASTAAQQQQPPPKTPPPPPLLAVNDLELMTLFGAKPPGPDDAEDEAMAA